MPRSDDERTQELDETADERRPAIDEGGQSGDNQGLPTGTDETEESVEELVESGQDFEAEIVEGMEDAADHPERPVHTHEDLRAGQGGPDRSSGD